MQFGTRIDTRNPQKPFCNTSGLTLLRGTRGFPGYLLQLLLLEHPQPSSSTSHLPSQALVLRVSFSAGFLRFCSAFRRQGVMEPCSLDADSGKRCQGTSTSVQSEAVHNHSSWGSSL